MPASIPNMLNPKIRIIPDTEESLLAMLTTTITVTEIRTLPTCNYIDFGHPLLNNIKTIDGMINNIRRDRYLFFPPTNVLVIDGLRTLNGDPIPVVLKNSRYGHINLSVHITGEVDINHTVMMMKSEYQEIKIEDFNKVTNETKSIEEIDNLLSLYQSQIDYLNRIL